MNLKKNTITTAIASALGLCIANPAQSAAVISIQIQDVGSTLNGVDGGGAGTYSATLDGNSGGFRMSSASSGINPSTYFSTFRWTGDAGTGTLQAQGAANSTGSFSTGFYFFSTPFVPFTFGSGVNADIDGGNNLTFSSLDFGGNDQVGGPGLDFFTPPDPGTLKVNWVVDGANTNEKLVSFQWSHLITTAEDPSGMGQFAGFTAYWIIEGTATMVPVPAAVWLFASGLAGLVGIARRRHGNGTRSR